jgi:uncharacterized protein involved in exopolysaccharide biosynthesis
MIQKEFAEQPVSFLTIIEILREKKWFVIIISLAGFCAALVVSFFIHPTYKTTLNLEVGKVWGFMLEAPQEICETILSEPFLQKVIQMNSFKLTPGELKSRISAETTKDAQKRILSIIKLSAKGNTPEECVAIVQAIASAVQKDDEETYNEWMQLNLGYQQELGERIQKLKKEIDELKVLQIEQIKNPGKEHPPILHLEGYAEEQETSYLALLQEYHKTNSNNNSRFYSRKTYVRYPAPVPTKPDSPHILLNAIGGLFLAFLCSLAWVSYKKYTS